MPERSEGGGGAKALCAEETANGQSAEWEGASRLRHYSRLRGRVQGSDHTGLCGPGTGVGLHPTSSGKPLKGF